MNNYNNKIRGLQKSSYRPFLNKLDAVWIRSALGAMPDGYDFEFSPLAQPSNSELHDQRPADAQTDDIRLQQRVVRPSQVARKLMDQGLYAIDEKDITRIEKTSWPNRMETIGSGWDKLKARMATVPPSRRQPIRAVEQNRDLERFYNGQLRALIRLMASSLESSLIPFYVEIILPTAF